MATVVPPTDDLAGELAEGGTSIGQVTSLAELVKKGWVDAAEQEALQQAINGQPLRISQAMAEQIALLGPQHPLALQFIPEAAELAYAPEERVDPIGDDRHAPLPGIVHRHPNRALLMPTSICPVYCRFCFRRQQVGQSGALSQQALQQALSYIEQQKMIREVILTGGDPLMISVSRLKHCLQSIEAMEHVQWVRIHTRVPLMMPKRISAEMLEVLSSARVMVLHCNHPKELTPAAVEAIQKLHEAGLVLLSQSTLLRGINNDAETLEALFEGLMRCRVKPYYLHHPDLVQGTRHLRVSVAEGQQLISELRNRVSGVCLPTYVLDIPGGYGKVPIESTHLRSPSHQSSSLLSQCGTHYEITDPNGKVHPYFDPQ